ncbi:hypothetical protein BKA66DRAFT_191748 [Pyrenochaeta sp. MPI-SDFR-AT-0127]|nr:hypothetical protein BKA66DRAFT_191748 [Pyrenochaeta sp. MPI-SDFR-AT-0127]
MKLLFMFSLSLMAAGVALAALADNIVDPFPAISPSVNTHSNVKATQPYVGLPTAAPLAQDGVVGRYPFTLTITEYCQASEGMSLTVKGYFHAGDSGYTHHFKSNIASTINLGYPGTNLIIGPYDYWNQSMQFQYGNCKWGETGYKPCGWCKESQVWSPAGVINCTAGNQAPRTHTLSCNVTVAWGIISQGDSKSIAVREVLPVIEAEAHQPTKTVTQIPEVLATSSSETAAETLILPFHFQTTEYCENGAKMVKGRYSNGNLVRDMNLPPGLINNLDHLVPKFPPLSIGPFDHGASKLRFAYSNGAFRCEWNDDETWRQCGECRAGLWSSPPLNCGSGGSRVKHMDCSFILGVKT